MDSDENGELLALAREERSGETLGETSSDLFKKYPFRDSVLNDGTRLYENRAALYPFLERINTAKIPVYMTTGWYDLFTGDMFFWYKNLTVPKRLVVRPADHSEVEDKRFDLDFSAEAHRWFDYWLKGVKNGIMDEPSIYYYRMRAPKKEAWQTSDQWPPEKWETTCHYFGTGKTGSIDSINDGFLTTEAPAASDEFDGYTANYTTTSGKHSRWTAVNWSREYPDMRSNDEKGLTYTSSPLQTDLEVTGHPVANLWLSADVPDLDVFVYLEEVDGKGTSTYITEGNLRASHRTLSQPPFNNLGLPYHSHYQSDLLNIPAGEPIELVFCLLPTSYRFHKGNRIRIAMVCADVDNFDTPVIDPAPTIRLLRDKNHPSCVRLPIVGF